jgi:carboxymethylenebutenolidase
MQIETAFPSSDGTPMPGACPVVASFGGRDVGMRGAPGHSFFTRTPGLKGRVVRRLPIQAEYHEAGAQDAHRRVLAFFREHLASS